MNKVLIPPIKKVVSLKLVLKGYHPDLHNWMKEKWPD
jgi:hypothetical protein